MGVKGDAVDGSGKERTDAVVVVGRCRSKGCDGGEGRCRGWKCGKGKKRGAEGRGEDGRCNSHIHIFVGI